MHTTDRAFEQGLAEALGEPMTSTQRVALDKRIGPLFDAPTRRSNRPSFARTAVAVVALTLVAVPVVVAGMSLVSTEAPYGTGDASAFEAEVVAAKAVTPIPPGLNWPAYLDHAPDQDAMYGTGGGRAVVEHTAYCMWLGYWRDAHEAGDYTAVATALSTLDDARNWQTFNDDLTPDAKERVDMTVGAAKAGDIATVRNELGLNCAGASTEQ